MSDIEEWSKEKLIAYIKNVQLKNQQLRKEKKSAWQQLQKSKQREAVLLEAVEFYSKWYDCPMGGCSNLQVTCEACAEEIKIRQALEKYRELEGSE